MSLWFAGCPKTEIGKIGTETAGQIQLSDRKNAQRRLRAAITRGIWRIFRETSERDIYKYLLADDPVVIEPVSELNSLLTGKLTGNFVIFACARQFSQPDGA
jgi:hypothetical protein